MPVLISNNTTGADIDRLANQELRNTAEDRRLLEAYTRNLGRRETLGTVVQNRQSTYRGDAGVRESMRRLMPRYLTNLNAFSDSDGIRQQIENFEGNIGYSDRMIPLLSSQLRRWDVSRNIILPHIPQAERAAMNTFDTQSPQKQRELSALFTRTIRELPVAVRQQLAAAIRGIVGAAMGRVFSNSTSELGHSAPARGNSDRGNINITVRDTAKLIWTAICDDAAYPLANEERQLIATGQTTEAAIRARNMQDRKLSFFKSLWEFQTEYGNSAACAHGSYNKLVETLSMVHPDVNIEEGETVSIDMYAPMVNGWLTGQYNPPGHLAERMELYNRHQHPIRPIWDDTEFFDGINETRDNNKLMSAFKAQIRVDVQEYIDREPILMRLSQATKRSLIANVMDNVGYLVPTDQPAATPVVVPSVQQQPTAPLHPVAAPVLAPVAIPADAVPRGYDPANEFAVTGPRLVQTLRENLLTTPVRTGAEHRSRVVLNTRNAPYTGPYSDRFGVGLDFPNIPCVHPYEPNGQIHPAPYDNGNPSFPIAVSLPGAILSSLPEGIRELLIRNNINFNDVTVNFGAQNMPWNNAEQLLFRAHPLVHQDAPNRSAVHHEEITNISAGIFDLNARMEQLAPLEVITHNEGADPQVLFSPRNAQITGINGQASHSFYSVCIIPAEGVHPARAAITLHWLLNRDDYTRVVAAIDQNNAFGIPITLQDIIGWPATWNNGTSLNVPVGGITPCEALRTLCTLGGDRANPNPAANRYRLQEQIGLGNQIPASAAHGQTSAVHDASHQATQPEVTPAPNVLSERQLLSLFEAYWGDHRTEFPAGFMPRRNGIPAGWTPPESWVPPSHLASLLRRTMPSNSRGVDSRFQQTVEQARLAAAELQRRQEQQQRASQVRAEPTTRVIPQPIPTTTVQPQATTTRANQATSGQPSSAPLVISPGLREFFQSIVDGDVFNDPSSMEFINLPPNADPNDISVPVDFSIPPFYISGNGSEFRMYDRSQIEAVLPAVPHDNAHEVPRLTAERAARLGRLMSGPLSDAGRSDWQDIPIMEPISLQIINGNNIRSARLFMDVLLVVLHNLRQNNRAVFDQQLAGCAERNLISRAIDNLLTNATRHQAAERALVEIQAGRTPSGLHDNQVRRLNGWDVMGIMRATVVANQTNIASSQSVTPPPQSPVTTRQAAPQPSPQPNPEVVVRPTQTVEPQQVIDQIEQLQQRRQEAARSAAQQIRSLADQRFTTRQFEAYWEAHRDEFPAGFMPRRSGMPEGWTPRDTAWVAPRR